MLCQSYILLHKSGNDTYTAHTAGAVLCTVFHARTSAGQLSAIPRFLQKKELMLCTGSRPLMAVLCMGTLRPWSMSIGLRVTSLRIRFCLLYLQSACQFFVGILKKACWNWPLTLGHQVSSTLLQYVVHNAVVNIVHYHLHSVRPFNEIKADTRRSAW